MKNPSTPLRRLVLRKGAAVLQLLQCAPDYTGHSQNVSTVWFFPLRSSVHAMIERYRLAWVVSPRALKRSGARGNNWTTRRFSSSKAQVKISQPAGRSS